MKVQVWEYLSEYVRHREEILEAVDRVFSSGRLILGDCVASFEREFSKYCDSEYGVGVNSGTDALFLALVALGVGKGDEVITVPNTAVPTVSAIESTGAKTRFVDIDPNSYLMDPSKIEDAITERTKCILPVHLYGQCANMNEINAVAKKHNLYVIEDCAQSAGAQYRGKKSGALGDVAAFSFYPTKVLGGYGDGGMVVTNNAELSDKVRSQRMYGMRGRYYAEEHGYNSRLDEVQAEILRLKLGWLDGYIEARRDIARRYSEQLGDCGLILPVEVEGNYHTYYVYVVRHPDRDRILEQLKENQIFVNISYPYPISTMHGYDHLGYKIGDFPITEQVANEIFSLPMYPMLKPEQQDYVCEKLREILGNG